ncbi:MAG: ferrochelatase [Campylobacterales bacterium]
MGGPRDKEEFRLFLTNMFNDPAIIAAPPFVRKWLAKFIVWRRLDGAWHHYEAIGGSSPLVGIMESLAEKLAQKVGLPVWIAMRYSPPFADVAAKELVAQGVDDLLLLPLYPQYSTTTTESSLRDFIQALSQAGFRGKTKVVKKFYDHRPYNELIIDLIMQALNQDKAREYDLIFSAHGLPQKVIDKGDPYQRHLKFHLWHLRKILQERGITFRRTHLAYQSKVGPMKWLEPSLEEKLRQIRPFTNKVVIFPIAFTIDNLETLYELHEQYREVAQKLGFKEYRVARLPNDSPQAVEALATLIDF